MKIRNSLRILYLATDAYGAYGGIAQYNRDCIEALAAMDEVRQIDVIQRIGKRDGGQRPQKVKLLGTIFNKYIYSLRAVLHAVLNPPDVVFNAHIYHSGLSNLIAKIFGARLMSQLHGTEVWRPLPRRIVETLQRSDLVLCVSRDTKKRYLRQLPDEAVDNAVIQHNTVSNEFTVGDRSAAREKFGIEGEFVLLSVGRLDARKGGYKGHERVINALPDILSKGYRVSYLIAGIGDDSDRLKQIVGSQGLEEVVCFLGKVPGEQLPDLYRAADLFVLPSTGEGFGIVYIEAMACGTPAMGLRVGGAPDALADGELGICVDPIEFEGQLISFLDRAAPERQLLSAETQTLFGKERFLAKLQTIMKPHFRERK